MHPPLTTCRCWWSAWWSPAAVQGLGTCEQEPPPWVWQFLSSGLASTRHRGSAPAYPPATTGPESQSQPGRWSMKPSSAVPSTKPDKHSTRGSSCCHWMAPACSSVLCWPVLHRSGLSGTRQKASCPKAQPRSSKCRVRNNYRGHALFCPPVGGDTAPSEQLRAAPRLDGAGPSRWQPCSASGAIHTQPLSVCTPQPKILPGP